MKITKYIVIIHLCDAYLDFDVLHEILLFSSLVQIKSDSEPTW